MGKKIETLKKAVFFAKEDPMNLAKILADTISDVATTIIIAGDTSIEIPASGDTTKDYEVTTLSQFGDEMTGATLALNEEVTGVSVSGNTVTVASTCSATSFVLKATNGTKTETKTITLTTAE